MKNESLVSDKSLEQLRKAQGIVPLEYCENGLDRYIITYEEYIKKAKKKKYDPNKPPHRE